MKIAITGGTGLVGKALTKPLLDEGAEVVILTRRRRESHHPRLTYIEWLREGVRPEEQLAGTDVLINLAGEGIGNGRWTPAKKEKILQSRMEATRECIRIMNHLHPKPRLFISASAIEAVLPKPPSSDLTELKGLHFLAHVVHRWEEEARKAEAMGIRTVITRFGILLGRDEGALPGMVMPFRFFMGGRVGSGKQWLSWIHVDDVAGIILHAMRHEEIAGPIPVIAPNPVTMDQMGREIARLLHRPYFFPVPGVLMKLALGEMAHLLLEGHKANTDPLLSLGYRFRFPTIQSALNDLLIK